LTLTMLIQSTSPSLLPCNRLKLPRTPPIQPCRIQMLQHRTLYRYVMLVLYWNTPVPPLLTSSNWTALQTEKVNIL
jgi:hypothetical protein